MGEWLSSFPLDPLRIDSIAYSRSQPGVEGWEKLIKGKLSRSGICWRSRGCRPITAANIHSMSLKESSRECFASGV